MCERWGIPFDIQQKGVTPVSTVPGSPAITGSFWMVTDHKPAWSQL